jgi:glucosyl-3-phosphoglycerate synthase
MDLEQRRITRIHDFSMNLEGMKSRLGSLRQKYPSGVIVPLLGNELETPAIKNIFEELSKCNYLKKIFIALSAIDQKNYEDALRLARTSKVACDVIWCNKPEAESVLKELKKKGLDVTRHTGKGKDIWIAVGIASLELHAFALHDGDIVSYSEKLPTKLLYPVVEPRLDFSFSKGYYARVNVEQRKMYGRIYRLFINPVLDALKDKMSYRSEFIRYLQSFSYPLAGEIAIYGDLALNLRIPCHWGLEMGMLAELFRNVSYKRILEVDLGFYEHKHRNLIKDGLLRTAEDTLVTLFRTLAETDGLEVSEPFLLSLRVLYRRIAQDRIRQYNADAFCNEIDYDRHGEESCVDLFSKTIMRAGQAYMLNPSGTQLPDWLRALSAMPDLRERLRETAIEQ